MAKKPRYSLDQHEELGKELQTMRDRLTEISVSLSRAYPCAISSKANKALQAVDALRNTLDDEVCRENPGTEGITQIYYRANRTD